MGKLMKSVIIAETNIPYNDLLPKDLPMNKKLMMNRGYMIITIETPLGNPKKEFRIWDIPPTPPRGHIVWQ
jgi:hypothetical protein